MEEKIAAIKEWLGTGSINIFGLPMSGKDTQGVRLAEALGARLLSSGMIIREMEKETAQDLSSNGALIPTDTFYEWVLPYFGREDLKNSPLVLSSIGRWFGEENQVMASAEATGHKIAAVIVLNLSEEDVRERFAAAKLLGDRGDRADDKDEATFEKRLEEFRIKTAPVLMHYQTLGLLIPVDGDRSRDEVFTEIIDKLYTKVLNKQF